MMLSAWKLAARILFWRGHSVPHIAQSLGRTINDVEAVLFARVGR